MAPMTQYDQILIHAALPYTPISNCLYVSSTLSLISIPTPILANFIIACLSYKSHDERGVYMSVWVCVWESRRFVSRTRPMARFNREGIPGGTFDSSYFWGGAALLVLLFVPTTTHDQLPPPERVAVLIIAGNAGHWCAFIVYLWSLQPHCDLLQYSLRYGDSSSQNRAVNPMQECQ